MTGNALIDRIFMGLNLLFVFGSIGLVGYAHMGVKKEITDQIAEFDKLKNEALLDAQVTPVKIKKIVVNIISTPDRLRFLELEMDILTFDNKTKIRVTDSEHVIKNALITVADQMTFEDLSSMTGKLILANRLKKIINDSFGETIIKQIYFSSYIVQ